VGNERSEKTCSNCFVCEGELSSPEEEIGPSLRESKRTRKMDTKEENIDPSYSSCAIYYKKLN